MNTLYRSSKTHPVAGPLACLMAVMAASAAGAEPLTLRVNDTTAVAGGIAAVTLRTYASRPVGQGQLCMQFALRGAQGPVATVEGATVFSVAGDAVEKVFFDGGAASQPTMVTFSSASATINATDGPLAVVYLRMHEDLAPGTEYDVLLDLPNTVLVDAEGKSIDVEARHGVVTIRDPAAPVEVSGFAESAVAGENAVLGMQTNEQFAIQAGQVGVRYDPALAPSWIKVSMDARHGNASFEATTSPGLVLVTFSSPDGSLNGVPGDLVSVRMPTNARLTRPMAFPVYLDPALTFLWDADGQVIPVTFEADTLEILPGPVYDPVKPRSPVAVLRRR